MKQHGAVLTDTKAFPSFSVDDIDKARRFYHDTLGVAVEERREGLELDIGDGHRVLVYPKPDHTPATYTILNFQVDDVDEAVDRLTSDGVIFERYDLPGIKTDARGIARNGRTPTMAWFRDPAGNIRSVIRQQS